MDERNFFDDLYDLHDTNEVREHYDRFAGSYDRELMTRGYAQPRRVATALVERDVPSDAAILDAGCGTGLSGVALADRGFEQIHGCDYSDEMLARAGQVGVYQSLQNVDLNEPHLSLEGGPFDVIALVGVFGHGHVRGSALGALAEHLVAGGLLIAGVNELAYPEGDLKAGFESLEADGILGPHEAEHGDHIPGLGSMGWLVVSTRM